MCGALKREGFEAVRVLLCRVLVVAIPTLIKTKVLALKLLGEFSIGVFGCFIRFYRVSGFRGDFSLSV